VHRLDRGRHHYRVRCNGSGRGASGTITVLRDSGSGRLPRTAPTSLIDADGRTYQVLFQNQLPSLTIRWRNPPPGPYRLVFSGNDGPPPTAARPTFTFTSGSVHEGTHRFVIEAGSRRSPETRLSVRFDNAARTASVQSPANQSFSPGQTVHVAGAALPGWSVSVGGHAIELDASQRFSGDVTAPAGVVVIRLSHPHHGVHYYLRRPRGGR
jgi:hypothetical protein